MDSLGGNCQAVLIPSARDLHHAFVYPQPPFPSEQNQLVKSFWDPSLLSIGKFVATSLLTLRSGDSTRVNVKFG